MKYNIINLFNVLSLKMLVLIQKEDNEHNDECH